MHGAARYTGVEQNTHSLRSDQRRLFGRLGQHGVTGSQSGGDLTAENRQREVPRADAHHRAQRAVAVIAEVIACLRRVVAQEVHRLAHFGNGVGEGLTGFTYQQAHQLLHFRFHLVGGAIEHGGALGRQGRLPDLPAGYRAEHGVANILLAGFMHIANDVTVVRRVAYRLRFAQLRRFATKQRHGLVSVVGAAQQRRGQRTEAVFVGQVDSFGVQAGVAIQRTWQSNARVWQAKAAFLRSHLLDLLYRVEHQLLDRDAVVGDTVDERGVRAVFQQTTHQISQQGFMAAHWGVDTARTVQLAIGNLAHHLLVQRLAHAVQALELILTGVVVLPGQLVDGRQRVGVVGGELRVDGFRHGQQLARAGDVGNIGVRLAGIHRVAFQAFDLGALDLAVPVRAFYQTDHQAMAAALGQVDDVVDHIRAALLVGLDDEADTVPAGQGRVEAQALEQIEGDLQAVGFFGIDVQADVVLLGQLGQAEQDRVQLVHHAVVLGAAVTWVQGGELDRDARAFVDATAVRGLADGMDGLLVGRQIAFGVFIGQRGFTEHVVGITEAFAFHVGGVGQGFGDSFAGNKLLAHQAHGHVHALADQWLAAFADNAV